MEDYYRILNVSRLSTTGQVRKAITDKRAELAKLKVDDNSLPLLLEEAERVLLDATRRISYDLELRRWVRPPQSEQNTNPKPPLSKPPTLQPPVPPRSSLPPHRQQNCVTCGSNIPEQAIFCPSCNSPVGDSNQNHQHENDERPPPRVPPPDHTVDDVVTNKSSLFFGAQIQGTVISVDSYEVRRRKTFSWILKLLLIASLVIFLIHKFLPILIVVALILLALLIFTKFGSTLVQIFLLPLTLFSKASFPSIGENTMRITNLRVRQENHTEVHVRIDGELVLGSIMAGDEVTIKGRFSNGTLKFSSGKNRRTNSALRKAWFS